LPRRLSILGCWQFGFFYKEKQTMRVLFGTSLVLAAAIAVVGTAVRADDVKSGVTDRTGGPFDVKAFTGDNKGKTLCYV